ncbi:enoyl-CoA hydratase-related protein [Corynebacterium guangdongense]|uniref:Enoyl-CoA hydratase n=1 Tax=Corynebacterium guangdongense TaxID=1783348 RepID=A0ABU1ZZZ3_9CORY|nr:enoyl-CoA hydratase-related protein [Corynebacterium guangdongense]MDR7330320.1 enoyl-CoA hydratase [Corynebacterium guangdongense]WJZ18878.1 putative enoyl-CoA hydratase echA6 [Corynebacterium guangdongense]
MTEEQLVLSRRLDEGRVSLLTLNRDAKRNALSVELCRAVEEALRDCLDSGARAVVLTAAGSVFSAGADLAEKDFAGELYPALEHLMTAIRRHPTVVIAAVDGPAIGAGAMLAMACDVRVVGPDASFRIPVTDMAIGVDEDTVTALNSLVGGSRARAMLLLGTELDAEAALDSGFAMFPGDAGAALDLARQAARKAPLTVAQLKMEFAGSFSATERADARAAAWNSEDFREVGLARVEKRPPHFHGR